MVLELAIQSIENKLRLKSGTMLGNYEFYYAAGILCRKMQLDPGEYRKPLELYEYLGSQIEGKEISDPQASHLIKMIRYYKVEDCYDEQMGRLFQMGLRDKGDS